MNTVNVFLSAVLIFIFGAISLLILAIGGFFASLSVWVAYYMCKNNIRVGYKVETSQKFIDAVDKTIKDIKNEVKKEVKQ